MKKIELNGAWKLSWNEIEGNECHEIDAQVPGNVIGDLFRNGVIPDPYLGCNSYSLRKYEFIDWEYKTTFRKPEFSAREKVRLVFEGIDTIADIFVNGIPVGHAENMVIPHAFDLDPSLLRDENELSVKIKSTVNYARTLPQPKPYNRASSYSCEGLRLRRPVHTYGWDIAPRIVGAGIWRKVYLEVLEPERWTDVYLNTLEIHPDYVDLSLVWSFVSDAPTLENYEAKLSMVCGSSSMTEHIPLYYTSGCKHYIKLRNPLLWWPLGSGPQNLYDVSLELIHNGKTVDTRCWKMGLRTIELIRDDMLDPSGKGNFHFKVNGKKIFIKGSNWVPANAMHGENTERIRKSLALFEELGCNMVRCWGGNVYENDEFFDWCDEHGLLVWQDFMFACETAPQDDAFLEEARKEAEAVITALRHHPSLALWCGDNECDEWIYYSPLHRKILPSQNRITRETLPRAVQMCDPMRDFLPSSPYLCDRAQRIHDQYIAPEQHLWSREVWKGTFFKDNNAVFASEIGYLGMSDFSSIEKFIPKEELNDTQGLSWICHSTQPFGDRKGPWSNRISIMERAVKGFFGSVPEKLQSFVICSQIVQAEAFKYFVELFRAKKWNKSGIIWWNMVDCWPQISFSVVDYYYVRKLAFYYLKTAQQPLDFIIEDPDNWRCRLIADNDLPEPASGTFKVSDLMTGETFAEGGFSIPADTAADVTSFPVSGEEQRMLLIEWEIGGRRSYNHYMLGNAPVKPELYLQWLDKLDELIYRPLGRNEWRAGDF